ncbi:Trp biosynthesis-associated membrane protein [Nocardioides sp. zg-536]|uniref:Trp biosynthesis-associated membrane protein n=1 Tax=Nocardioides faecalis TaxID=2803858 RepID=A0A938Y7A2_9ACTN|nr:Trp biosynthesis-associated membrane protein [Nocardioides faecalis]MBM9460514.1 Trp biosynthesis-associated membrane protein [Nocardioides faecalis]QVI57552.1 Trp biosynthesis-associated membrane protein [Nocardioides faecalis]
MSRARRTFGPAVLAGLAGGGAAAVGGHRAMLAVPQETLTAAGGLPLGLAERSAQFALSGALALVVLACWGVLLVTRGVVRRVVAVLAALAAAGVVAVVVTGGFLQDEDAAADLAVRLGLNGAAISVERTSWLWLTLAGGLLALAAAVVAVRNLRSWPEMGTRYDAPGAETPHSQARPEDQSNLDLWKSLDDGDDPTAD